MSGQRNFDVIVFGATSFVGQILCRYLKQEFGTPSEPGARALRWGIAGRSAAKLKELQSSLGAGAESLTVFTAEATDANALAAMAKQTRVIVSTVGPYALHGDTLVKVCAESGTDYCDLTGEAHWVKKMIDAHEDSAKQSGARIVPCCGFDSIPSDLGTWWLQQQSLLHYGEPLDKVKMRVRSMRGGASGGTVASMLNIIREAMGNPVVRKIYANPYSLCPAQPKNSARQHNVKGAEFDAEFGAWVAPFIMSAINARVVLRSHALTAPHAGSSFAYDEGMMTGRGFKGRTRAMTFTAGLAAFAGGAAMAPTRWLMEKTILPAPGEGPSEAQQKSGSWDFRFIGRTADGRALKAKVTGEGDPGYGSTARMLGEAAACLAQDVAKSDLAGGFWTPSTALGEALVTRLTRHAGVTFELLDTA
ncbi:MAG: saccharopine dehydrogenase NADP-binding domain-containing protein [Betaproteobacteria bacterium]|nr:saccharopine dehydrogenase NADP-binding domain-containing protein [Betaproteobacteria bacterium]